MTEFKRGLSKDLTKALNDLALEHGKNWWKEVLANKKLLLAVRGGYLNAYSQGQSIFKVGPGLNDGNPVVSIHYKYLLEPSRPGKEYISFTGKSFVVEPRDVICTNYKTDKTLDRLIDAASYYASEEKKGVHAIALQNKTVVDLEVAFTETGEVGEDARERRIDLAALHKDGEGKAKLVFYEAKRADDPRLRARSNSEAEVVKQMESYDKFLHTSASHLARAYKDVCATLVKLCSSNLRSLDPIIGEVGAETRTLSVDQVARLLVFGFDQDQKFGELFMRHIETLQRCLAGRVVAKGNPASFDLLSDYVRFPPSAPAA
ncbi:MAG: hypothetical protein DMG27_19145 [Acidobacteria bacterium]|nr:MAG: hypothetical protein DMG27_19145 [Acidobacteriota bacterium]